MPETLLTVKEAAARLRINPTTLRRQLRAGKVRHVRTGKMWRIPESVVTASPAVSAPDAQEVAQRLAALEALGRDLPGHRAAAGLPPVELSGERGNVYDHTQREQSANRPPANGTNGHAEAQGDTQAQARAAALLAGLDSDNPRTRNAAIVALTRADATTRALVDEAVAQTVEAHLMHEDDLGDWRALGGEPFYFPEEAKKTGEAHQ